MGNFNISVKLKYARGFLCKIWKVNSLSNSNKNLLLSQPSAGGIVILSPRCFNKLSTSEFQQFLSLQYFVDTFYWSGRVEVCLGQRERFIAILISSPGTAFSTLYANIVYRHRQFSTMHHQAGMVQ